MHIASRPSEVLACTAHPLHVFPKSPGPNPIIHQQKAHGGYPWAFAGSSAMPKYQCFRRRNSAGTAHTARASVEGSGMKIEIVTPALAVFLSMNAAPAGFPF